MRVRGSGVARCMRHVYPNVFRVPIGRIRWASHADVVAWGLVTYPALKRGQ